MSKLDFFALLGDRYVSFVLVKEIKASNLPGTNKQYINVITAKITIYIIKGKDRYINCITKLNRNKQIKIRKMIF